MNVLLKDWLSGDSVISKGHLRECHFGCVHGYGMLNRALNVPVLCLVCIFLPQKAVGEVTGLNDNILK